MTLKPGDIIRVVFRDHSDIDEIHDLEDLVNYPVNVITFDTIGFFVMEDEHHILIARDWINNVHGTEIGRTKVICKADIISKKKVERSEN